MSTEHEKWLAPRSFQSLHEIHQGHGDKLEVWVFHIVSFVYQRCFIKITGEDLAPGNIKFHKSGFCWKDKVSHSSNQKHLFPTEQKWAIVGPGGGGEGPNSFSHFPCNLLRLLGLLVYALVYNHWFKRNWYLELNCLWCRYVPQNA